MRRAEASGRGGSIGPRDWRRSLTFAPPGGRGSALGPGGRQHAMLDTDQSAVYQGVMPEAQHQASSKFARNTNRLEGCRTMGAHEIILDPTFSVGAQRLDRWLERMERLRTLA